MGDAVEVTSGPYAGRPGVIQAVGADGRYRVFIDECCQPDLAAGQLRRTRRGRGIADRQRDAKLADRKGELVRHEIDSRDMGTGF